VVRAGKTPLPVIRQSIRRLARVDAEPLGVILNSVDFEKAHKYYGEYSGYASLKHGEYAYIDGQKVYGSPGYGSGLYGYLRRKPKKQGPAYGAAAGESPAISSAANDKPSA
jgi:Mrp family chromosome partitioning ATPase